MKKKLMMVAVLLGALTLGACVDDNESASVTKVREAKAAQLNAAAELSSAQAKAAITAAEAEAKLKEAQAEYEKAKAAAEQADADQQAELTRQAKLKFEEELAYLQAWYAAQIANYNALKLQYEKDVWDNTDANIQNVYQKYTAALGNVNNYTTQLLKKQTEKSKLQADIVTAKETMKQQLAAWSKELADLKREIAKLEEMKNASSSDYLAEMDKLEKTAYDLLQNKIPAANATEKMAKQTYDAAVEEFNNGEKSFAKAVEELNGFVYDNGLTKTFASATPVYLVKEEREDFLDNFGYYPDGNYTYYQYELASESQIQYATIAVDDKFTEMLKNADNLIKNAEGVEWDKDDDGKIQIGAESASLNGAKSALAYRNQQIADKKKDITAKEAEITEAEKAATPDKNAIEALKGELKTLQGELTSLEDVRALNAAITAAEEALATAKDNKVKIEEAQKEYQANLVILKDAAAKKAYEDAFASLEKMAAAYIEAQTETALLEDAKNEIGIYSISLQNGKYNVSNGSGSYSDVKNLYGNVQDLASLIDEKNERIAELNGLIDNVAIQGIQIVQVERYYQYYVMNPTTGEYEFDHYESTTERLTEGTELTAEQALAICQAEIDLLTEKIKVEKALAAKYEAELNNLINAKEETPA